MAIRKSLIVAALSSLALTGCGSNGAPQGVGLNQNTSQAVEIPSNTSASTPENTPENIEPDIATAGPFVAETASTDQDETLDTIDTVDNTLTCDTNSEQFQSVFIELINQVRAQPRQCGNTSHAPVEPLSLNTKLVLAAERHNTDMAANNFFSHTGSDNTGVADRVDAVDYNWQAVGENLAAGQPSLQEAMSGWLDSPGHCRNIMSANFKETGLACTENQSTEFGIYWTNVFGTQFE